MKSAKVHQEEEEEEEEETPLSASKGSGFGFGEADGKGNDKVSSTRSKHSVTEQRRRSKINERFQILRDLIPRSDQKRDTASFLLEVIEYVHYMQEKVQKYEGSYQGWVSEPSKLMPWRNSHWRVQSFVGHPQPTMNGSSPGSTFTGRLDENNSLISPTVHPNQLHSIEADSSGDPCGKMVDLQPELTNKSVAVPMPLQATIPQSIQCDGVLSHSPRRRISDAQSTDYPSRNDGSNPEEDLMVEGGTINIRSAYSQGLLDNLTQALKSAGVDLSQATISVQIDLGKRANTGLTPDISLPKDSQNSPSHPSMGGFGDAGNGEDLGQAQKRLKK